MNSQAETAMTTVEEECDETFYGMEWLVDSGQMKQSKLSSLMNEAEELLKIAVASSKTARRGSRPQ